MDQEIDVPSDFLCPISMQLMRDPVTVSTGITYDRDSIERWLFSCNNNTCPVTKQMLSCDTDLIPNHALRRLIQSWCMLNASYGIERIPTPKPPVDKSQIKKLINGSKNSLKMQQKCLQQLRIIAYGSSQRDKKCLEDVGAIEFLASLVWRNESNFVELAIGNNKEFKKTSDEALCLLYRLEISEAYRKKMVSDTLFMESLFNVLKCDNLESRAYAIMLMRDLYEVADPSLLISIRKELFIEIARILGDKISQQAVKAALKLLTETCPWGRNRIKAVEAGLTFVLVEIILESSERRACELVMVVLDQLCGSAEGRAELLSHGAGLAVVSKKILRVSNVATDRAVRVLSSICRFSASSRVLQEMLQVGVVSKLCLVLQVDASVRTKDRVKEILKLHSRVWRNTSCIPPHLFSSYPSS